MRLSEPATDAFVIGGGPAGLAAAIALRRKGLRVILADALRPPIDKVCGEGLMPDALAALRELGISIRSDTAFPFRGIHFVNGADRAGASFPTGFALGVRRTTLHAQLVEHAGKAGVRMLWGEHVTGIERNSVEAGGRKFATRWILGADGGASRVRRWAGLEATWRNARRFGFRRHYRVEPWTDCMEVHWGPGCQVYLTPVGAREVCLALISRDPKLRLDAALGAFPQLLERLSGASIVSTERGAVTTSRRLRRVAAGSVALIGDASGSVDAITGEGLCLAFKQAVSLASAIESGNLAAYQAEHRRIARRPAFMAEFMLHLGESPMLRARAIRALSKHPHLFARMLAMHVGELNPARFALTSAALGARMLVL